MRPDDPCLLKETDDLCNVVIDQCFLPMPLLSLCLCFKSFGNLTAFCSEVVHFSNRNRSLIIRLPESVGGEEEFFQFLHVGIEHLYTISLIQ